MLLDAKLFKENLGEAVCTAVYLKNRWPTKSLKGIIPYESWFEETQQNMSEYFAVMLMVTFPKMKQASRIPKPENVDIPVIQNKIIIRKNVKFSEEERAESSTPES